MPKFKKKSIIIEANQWFKNGDHPADKSEMIQPDPRSTTQFEPFLSEGDIVRFYCSPKLDDNQECKHCGKIMFKHGWIDTLEGGYTVCPGDWIITGIKGEYYPCKPDIFVRTYEPVK